MRHADVNGIINQSGDFSKVDLYAFLIGAGASLAVWRVTRTVVPKLALRWAWTAVGVLFGALLGARLGYLFWQPNSFTNHFWQLFRINQGGLVWFGAFPAAWLVIWGVAKFRSLPFTMVADRVLTMLPPMAIMTWLACWASGSGYGELLENAWWAPLSIDERGLWAVRFPLQWVAALSLFLIFAIFEGRFPKNRPGQRAALTWLIFCAHTLLFSFLRADPRPVWHGVTWDEWAAIFYLAGALIFFLVSFWPRKHIEHWA